ncbi:MAG: spore maturation protein [Firmicutes bacterium]|nr:spore maturation protein [Bacillota bacterium]
MMNYIWSAIFLIAFLYSCLTGKLSLFADALTDSSTEAVQFVIGLAGVMALWSGLMEIAERTGLITKMSRLLLPLTKFLFPNQRNPETLSSIIMSFMANIFGAGNSSTVFALRTMEKLDEENHHGPVASNDMCTFAVVNMAFAPIIPIVMLQIRDDIGSADPYSVVLPSIITAVCTIIASVIACKILERRP